MSEKLLNYFKGDDMAANVWQSKYQLKNEKGFAVEETPDDMHRRMAKEFARIEYVYIQKEKKDLDLSNEGHRQQFIYGTMSLSELEDYIYSYFKNFSKIVPQGSIMSMLGNKYQIGSLSNCFVIASPEDSYGGILHTDEEMAQLMKRRGGVGTNLNKLRPAKTRVNNAAGSSTGAASFMERYSSTTREVAQDGRRK